MAVDEYGNPTIHFNALTGDTDDPVEAPRFAVVVVCTILPSLLTAFATLEALSPWAGPVASTVAAVVAVVAILLLMFLVLLPGDPASGVSADRLLASRYGIDGIDRPDAPVPASGTLEVHRTRPDRCDTWTIVRGDDGLIRVYDADGNAFVAAANADDKPTRKEIA